MKIPTIPHISHHSWHGIAIRKTAGECWRITHGKSVVGKRNKMDEGKERAGEQRKKGRGWRTKTRWRRVRAFKSPATWQKYSKNWLHIVPYIAYRRELVTKSISSHFEMQVHSTYADCPINYTMKITFDQDEWLRSEGIPKTKKK